MDTTSRRQFLRTTAVTTGGVLVARSLSAWGFPSAEVTIVPQLSVFGYSQVQLLDGPFRRQFDQNHDVFLHLDEDAMLKPFRQRAGMPAPGPDMGGWYDNANDFSPADNFHGFIAGHSFGQYVSGLARAYAVTGSKPTQEKVQRLVRAQPKRLPVAGQGRQARPVGKSAEEPFEPAQSWGPCRVYSAIARWPGRTGVPCRGASPG